MSQQLSRSVQTNQEGVHERLEDYVQRHIRHSFQKPIQKHNEEAFSTLQSALKKFDGHPLILDSCCGTGMSSINLARLNPDALIIGLDQSYHRLNKYGVAEDTPENCILLRANCEDIWRLCADNDIRFEQHTIFYPNPWPKSVHLKRRWHGHPVFPKLKQLSTSLELRSNWKLYLEEFAVAWRILCGEDVLVKELEIKDPFTLFEKKYHASGQPLFQLKIENID
ncbi:tRNA (guanosine(46)-N(7))-methyltransferase TrmB [Aliikangiella sp. G2MR2-5]|uniref:tRNA (guanine(46)-N(7))-methyltransferase TrmB n=1 Tax=Aliikangiella sp. G2MR2-5 TaxID=2788943 RepID=UPI0018AA9753|nr:hypothetical protein [Aliikangiella sp. G2MR2-5]